MTWLSGRSAASVRRVCPTQHTWASWTQRGETSIRGNIPPSPNYGTLGTDTSAHAWLSACTIPNHATVMTPLMSRRQILRQSGIARPKMCTAILILCSVWISESCFLHLFSVSRLSGPSWITILLHECNFEMFWNSYPVCCSLCNPISNRECSKGRRVLILSAHSLQSGRKGCRCFLPSLL